MKLSVPINVTPTDHVETRIGHGMPFEIDALTGDLDSHHPGFADGSPISWGLVLSAIENSWNELHGLEGLDWEARFFPANTFVSPSMRWPSGAKDGFGADEPIGDPCVLIVVHTGAMTLNDARDAGRESIRGLVALIRRELPVIRLNEPIWEGGINRKTSGELYMTAVASKLTLPTALEQHPRQFDELRLRIAGLRLRSLDSHVLRALQFLSLARSASTRAEKFMHLWLSVIALASFGQPTRGKDKERVEKYTAQMGLGIAGVRSPQAIEALNRRFDRARKVRDRLFHRDDESGVTVELLTDLEAAAFQLIDFELAKAGLHVRLDH